jgi:hypothetical protein
VIVIVLFNNINEYRFLGGGFIGKAGDYIRRVEVLNTYFINFKRKNNEKIMSKKKKKKKIFF